MCISVMKSKMNNMKKGISKYPGLFKLCSFCSKKEKRGGLKKEDFFCPVTDRVVTERSDATTCEEFDGANIANLLQKYNN